MISKQPQKNSPIIQKIAKMGEILQPNHTLYLSNIDWSIKKPVLLRALFTLFSRHGKVLEVIALRKNGLRGQAWVIFENVAAATAALQLNQGFNFFGKNLAISYAKEKSDRVAKMDGTYKPKAKRAKMQAADISRSLEEVKKIKEEAFEATITTTTVGEQDTDANTEEDILAPPPPPPPTETSPPSNILFAQDIPPECTEVMLQMLFRQYPGFKEVRVPRQGLSFVEYENEAQATVALKAMDGFKLTQHDTLKLTYGKV